MNWSLIGTSLPLLRRLCNGRLCMMSVGVIGTASRDSGLKVDVLLTIVQQNSLKIHRTFQRQAHLEYFTPGPGFAEDRNGPLQVGEMEQVIVAEHKLTPASDVQYALARQDEHALIFDLIAGLHGTGQRLLTQGGISTIVSRLACQQTGGNRDLRQGTVVQTLRQLLNIEAVFALRPLHLRLLQLTRSLLLADELPVWYPRLGRGAPGRRLQVVFSCSLHMFLEARYYFLRGRNCCDATEDYFLLLEMQFETDREYSHHAMVDGTD